MIISSDLSILMRCRGRSLARRQVRSLEFKKGLKRVERLNARIAYIEGDMTKEERKEWEQLFEQVRIRLQPTHLIRVAG